MALINDDVYFISTEYIKKNSTVPEFLDDKYLNYAIIESQNIELQKCIGTPLYTSVYTYLKNYLLTGATIPTEYDELITSYIKPFLMYHTVYRALTQYYQKMLNTSIVVQNDNQRSSKVEYNAIEELRRQFMNNADWYDNRTVLYLTTQNTKFSKFPEWTSFAADADTILPNRGKNFKGTGLYFGSKQRRDDMRYGSNNSYDLGGKGWNENRGNGVSPCC